MNRQQVSRGSLARHGFSNSAAAQQTIANRPGDWLPLLEILAAAGDPDLALLGLDRLVERADGLFPRLHRDRQLARRLIAVLGASSRLQQHLINHPEQVGLLAAPTRRHTAGQWRAEMMAAVGAIPDDQQPTATGDPDLAADALRIAYLGGLLLVTARDLTAPDPLAQMPDIAGELSDLAAAVLESALAIARLRSGSDTGCRLAVIALGKCGAGEMNYASDVDVLFVAAAATGTAERLAADVMRICSAHTGAGTLFQVDAGLRPEGTAGPLVRTLDSHRGYYQKWAKDWEFQAMLKARPVAGDRELGAGFIEMITPMVWQVAEHERFIADTQRMRQRVIDHIPARTGRRELKLGEGGLRDVEFAVQLLQLVHGRADERLRITSTLGGLQALIDYGYVGRGDGAEFGLAYRFLRSLEHRIQLYRLQRTHVLPTGEDDLRRIGRLMGYQDPAAELQRQWQTTARQVRRLHRRLFYSPLLDAVASIPSAELRLTQQAAEDRLQALGYHDSRAALQHIRALTQGVTRQAEIQRQLLPAMLGWFADRPNPDHGLLAFRQTSQALGQSSWYLRALRDEGAMAQRLAHVLASSRYAVNLLQRAPEAVQMLADDTQLQARTTADLRTEMITAARRQPNAEQGVTAIRAVRRRELFRIAVADLGDRLDVGAVGAALSDLACATIDAALWVIRQQMAGDLPEGEQLPALAVIALGRWGGHEMGYGSDVDAMFVLADDAGRADQARLGIEIITQLRRLLRQPSADPGMSIDVDLRPEGRDGALARTLTAYRTYYQRWAASWELQALVRAQPGAGDQQLGQDWIEAIDQVRWPQRLATAQVTEIRQLKARMESERIPRGTDPGKHLKFGPGGLADVEWTIQLLQLRHAGSYPELRTPHTIEVLHAARQADLIDAESADALESAWLLASRIRNQSMLVRGKASDTFPSDPRELAAVAELIGYDSGQGSHLMADYRRVARRARRVTEDLFWRG